MSCIGENASIYLAGRYDDSSIALIGGSLCLSSRLIEAWWYCMVIDGSSFAWIGGGLCTPYTLDDIRAVTIIIGFCHATDYTTKRSTSHCSNGCQPSTYDRQLAAYRLSSPAAKSDVIPLNFRKKLASLFAV
jgi:hypothetical protein